ncbi:hypothetical protein VX159_09780 [Dechloromonas sp. ZY10]|uniref:hypothetical protein n=1 Tax=Dechloromonas aquae TaxID=2664436 RepID=UPI0035290673
MLRFVPTFSRMLSRILLMVMLATVFSPSFGWEIVEGSLPHDDAAAMRLVAATDGECHGHVQNDEAGATSDLSHHCCPGHVLGHLLGGVGEVGRLALPQAASLPVARDSGPFSSRIPEGLERPPRLAA